MLTSHNKTTYSYSILSWRLHKTPKIDLRNKILHFSRAHTETIVILFLLLAGMCTRPSEPRPRRDRDVQTFVRNETETRRCSFGDAGRDLEAPETLESLGSFSVSPRRFP